MPRCTPAGSIFRAAPRFGLFFGGIYAAAVFRPPPALAPRAAALDRPLRLRLPADQPVRRHRPLRGQPPARGGRGPRLERDPRRGLERSATGRSRRWPSSIAGALPALALVGEHARHPLSRADERRGLLEPRRGAARPATGSCSSWSAASWAALIAFLLFAITAVSLPLLLDRDVDYVTAMTVSFQAVTDNLHADAALGVDRGGARSSSAMLPMFLGLAGGAAGARPCHLAHLPEGDRSRRLRAPGRQCLPPLPPPFEPPLPCLHDPGSRSRPSARRTGRLRARPCRCLHDPCSRSRPSARRIGRLRARPCRPCPCPCRPCARGRCRRARRQEPRGVGEAWPRDLPLGPSSRRAAVARRMVRATPSPGSLRVTPLTADRLARAICCRRPGGRRTTFGAARRVPLPVVLRQRIGQERGGTAHHRLGGRGEGAPEHRRGAGHRGCGPRLRRSDGSRRRPDRPGRRRRLAGRRGRREDEPREARRSRRRDPPAVGRTGALHGGNGAGRGGSGREQRDVRSLARSTEEEADGRDHDRRGPLRMTAAPRRARPGRFTGAGEAPSPRSGPPTWRRAPPRAGPGRRRGGPRVRPGRGAARAPPPPPRRA